MERDPAPTTPVTTQRADYGRRSVVLGLNQFDLLVGAIEGLLDQLVEDRTADAPVAKQPWPGHANEVWDAIGQARGVLFAAEKWVAAQAPTGLAGDFDNWPTRVEMEQFRDGLLKQALQRIMALEKPPASRRCPMPDTWPDIDSPENVARRARTAAEIVRKVSQQEVCPECLRLVGHSDFGAPCTPVDCDYRAALIDGADDDR